MKVAIALLFFLSVFFISSHYYNEGNGSISKERIVKEVQDNEGVEWSRIKYVVIPPTVLFIITMGYVVFFRRR